MFDWFEFLFLKMKEILILLLFITISNSNADGIIREAATIEKVVPYQLQRSTVRTVKYAIDIIKLESFKMQFCQQLNLTINNLSPLNEGLVCAFSFANKSPIFTNAERTRYGVDCSTPQTDHLPPNPPGKRKFISMAI